MSKKLIGQDQWGEWEFNCPKCSFQLKSKTMLYLSPKKAEHMDTHYKRELTLAEMELWK